MVNKENWKINPEFQQTIFEMNFNYRFFGKLIFFHQSLILKTFLLEFPLVLTLSFLEAVFLVI